MSGIFSDVTKMANDQAETHRLIFVALQTANLIEVYKTPNLVGQLSEAERLELEKTIFAATGIRDA
jgi:hypothetical protein